jgi:hypothetical protein
MSLPSPLTVSDEYFRHRDGPPESVKVTAGLHRQVWVSGTNIFVDVRIANNLKKGIKRLELQLERDILCYKHVSEQKTHIQADPDLRIGGCVYFRKGSHPIARFRF